MLTIIRKDLLLTVNDNAIPAMGSSDVPVSFVNDIETYQGFLIEPRIGYYVNGCPKSTVCEYDTSSNIIKIPAEAFKNKGILVIAIALIDNEDSNHIEVTKELALEVTPAPNGTVILPATDTWQTAVKNLVEQIYNQDYKPQFDQIEEDLSGLVEEAENQQVKAKEQQTQIDNAIDIMGDYEIVQDNPTQIRFKKGNGTYGDTVNLGDNLASKSMVNAGYDTYSGNSYSGSASDYGIEVAQIIGAYEQDGTPTPDAPIEPQFVEINNFNTNGGNLFDASKLPTKTMAGATITNNGDGSFTISGSGSTSGIFDYVYFINDVELIRSLLKVGNITAVVDEITTPRFIFQMYVNGNSTPAINLDLNSSKSKTANITQDYLDNAKNLRIGFYANASTTIQQATIKPMVYQDGDGTWYPYNVSNLPLNKTYRALPNGVHDYHRDGIDTFNVGYVEFDGSSDENWQLQTSNDSSLPNHYQFYIANEKMLKSSVLICDKALYKNTLPDSQDNAVVSTGTAINFFIPKTSLSSKSVDEFKTWLQSNHIGIWYQLATPTTEQNNIILKSFYPFTNAWHDSEVEASDLTWNILARQYGSGQTTIKKDEAVLTELDLNTERTATPTTVKVQLKDTSGNTFYVETSADNVYLKGTDGSEISQKNLNDKIGQLINLVAFYSANPTTVLADLKKYITTIT